MGRQVRKWIMRIFAVVIVALMVMGLGANFFMAREQYKKQQAQQEEQAANESYFDGKNTFELEKIGQTILIPRSMEIESTTTEENNTVQHRFKAVRYDDMAVGLVIVEMDGDKGVDLNQFGMFPLEEAVNQYRSSEYENTNYLTFKGDSNNYVLALQTIFDNNDQYKYEVDYTITDIDKNCKYLVSLFLLENDNPSKTDMLKLDKLGKEMLSKTKYMSDPTVEQFALPEDSQDQFNRVFK